jgi:putative Holliday junction resolvase
MNHPTVNRSDDFPLAGRLVAIDYGTVRIGLAICDPDRILVSPLQVYERRTPTADRQFFASLGDEHRVDGFVVGLPIHCDGGESAKSKEARQFARWLQELTQVPTRLFDERFSTAQAKRRLRDRRLTQKNRKSRIDAVAAQVLLEAFVEVQQYTGRLPGEPVDTEAVGGDSLE